jgi:hypothetical protein
MLSRIDLNPPQMGKTDPGSWSHSKYCTCMHKLHLGWSVLFSFEMVLVHGGLSRMEWMDGALPSGNRGGPDNPANFPPIDSIPDITLCSYHAVLFRTA